MASALQRNRAEEILSSVPVRIADFDNAAKNEPAMLHGRLNTTFVTNYEDTAPPRREGPPSPDRLPEDLPPTQVEERGSGRKPEVERLPEDLPAQKAAPQQKTGLDWDVVEGETQRKERPKRRGGAGKEFNPYD